MCSCTTQSTVVHTPRTGSSLTDIPGEVGSKPQCTRYIAHAVPAPCINLWGSQDSPSEKHWEAVLLAAVHQQRLTSNMRRSSNSPCSRQRELSRAVRLPCPAKVLYRYNGLASPASLHISLHVCFSVTTMGKGHQTDTGWACPVYRKRGLKKRRLEPVHIPPPLVQAAHGHSGRQGSALSAARASRSMHTVATSCPTAAKAHSSPEAKADTDCHQPSPSRATRLTVQDNSPAQCPSHITCLADAVCARCCLLRQHSAAWAITRGCNTTPGPVKPCAVLCCAGPHCTCRERPHRRNRANKADITEHQIV